MLTVACVWKLGREYRPEHVVALYDGFRRNLTVPYRFACLTDGDVLPLFIETIPLKHGWPGWWSKLELFRPGLFNGPVFYADLDTVIVGNIDDLVHGHSFTVLENFWSQVRIGSGLMAWNRDLSLIYEKFARAPHMHMKDYVTTERWGDQGFIRFNTPVIPERWQHRFPGRIVSYKFHVRDKGGIPIGASIVCFHGKPRPWNTELWKGNER